MALRLVALSALVSAVVAHIDINYPLGTWTHTEEQQEEGGVCGGGSRVSGVAFGTQGAFVSLSGDEGQQVRIFLATTNSTSANTEVIDASSFPIVLSEGAAFSESGNLCLPVNLPASYVSGSRATLYVEAMGDGETVSSCAELVLVPSQLSNATVVEHGAAVVNEQTGGNYTFLDYYCSNSTIPALDTCSCHCHGDHAHCGDTCSDERIAEANTQCTSGETAAPSSTSAAPATQTSASATGSVGENAAAAASSPASGATKIVAGFGSLALGLAGVILLQ